MSELVQVVIKAVSVSLNLFSSATLDAETFRDFFNFKDEKVNSTEVRTDDEARDAPKDTSVIMR